MNNNNKQTGATIETENPFPGDSFGNWTRSAYTLDPWLSTSDSSWIDPIYSECFSDVYQSRRSRKQETTFQVIVVNLVKAESEICCPIDKRSWVHRDPLPKAFGISLIKTCVSALEKHGYLASERTFHSSKAKHPVTYIKPTDKLLRSSPMSLSCKINDEGIIRCNRFKRPDDYLDNLFISQRYHTAIEYNSLMSSTPEHQLYSVYVDDLNSMGRFAGSRVMMMPKADRRNLTIDGERLFEVDIKSCLPSIALAKTQGIKLGSDFYDIEDFPRDLIKAATVRALHCGSRRQAQQALQWWIITDTKGQQYKRYKVSEVFDALQRKVPRYEEMLYQNRGLEFMADESLRMSLFLENTAPFGIKTYPIHDAVMGKVSEQGVIVDVFLEAFTVNGIVPSVEIIAPSVDKEIV